MVMVVIAYYDLTSCLVLEMDQPRPTALVRVYFASPGATVANIFGVAMTLALYNYRTRKWAGFLPHPDARLALHTSGSLELIQSYHKIS